jgi:hypothetical protein
MTVSFSIHGNGMLKLWAHSFKRRREIPFPPHTITAIGPVVKFGRNPSACSFSSTPQYIADNVAPHPGSTSVRSSSVNSGATFNVIWEILSYMALIFYVLWSSQKSCPNLSLYVTFLKILIFYSKGLSHNLTTTLEDKSSAVHSKK